jgi:flagellar biosynthesis protein FliP
MPNHDWAQYSLSMTFVLLLLAAALWWLSRRNKGFLLPTNQRRIQILEAYPMGLRHKLLLVQVDQQRLLLSVTNSESKPCMHGVQMTLRPQNQVSTMRIKYFILPLLAVCILWLPDLALSQGLPMVTVNSGKGGQQYSLTLQLLGLMTVLTLLPSLLLMMTSFVRVIIVLSILRQALGTGQTPPNTVLVGLALFLTFFIMTPVFDDVYTNAVAPYMGGNLPFDQALAKAEVPVRQFMTLQTREDDIAMFMQIAQRKEVASAAEVPFTTLVPAFLTSELKSAFMIGFMIYIPFVVIDLIVASVLMSMGMMMLSPMIISMPFKLMLFVLVDGWTLIMGSLASSFIFK